MHTVQQILNQKGPYFNYIDADATVLDALTLMKTENISYLIVLDRGKFIGIFSERDYAHKVILMAKHSDTTGVKEIMTKDLPIIMPSATAEECMILMNAAKVRYLPVFDNVVFIGVITIHDLIREVIAQNEKSHESFREAMSEKSQRFYWV